MCGLRIGPLRHKKMRKTGCLVVLYVCIAAAGVFRSGVLRAQEPLMLDPPARLSPPGPSTAQSLAGQRHIISRNALASGYCQGKRQEPGANARRLIRPQNTSVRFKSGDVQLTSCCKSPFQEQGGLTRSTVVEITAC